LPGDAKDLRCRCDGQAQRFKTRAPHNTSGVGGIFHGHGVSLFIFPFYLVIVGQFNVKRIGALEAEDDSPIRPHANRPKPSKLAFERMQAIAGEIKLMRGRRVIEDSQNFLNCIREIRPYSATVVALVKSFEAAMLEAPHH
jgi:hypothetical protein